ncbi:MAG: hypothetical protein IT254_00025 [Chitinophagaceae bacterium]|nr:hypothetical protein [Bacteroidota bacterium]MCC6256686.1 hypothetical protein [Chitinophagaceae bacterium]
MKSILLGLLALTFVSSQAQRSVSDISLPMNKNIISKNEMVQNLDMGMGMLMNTNITTVMQYNVIGLTGDEYLISRKLTATKMNMEMMGQKQTYDSDLKSDADTEIGKEMSKHLNVPDTFSYNWKTGKATMISTKQDSTDESNPMEGMIKSIGGGSQELVIEDIFFPVMNSKNEGDKWVDSLSSKDLNYTKNYTLVKKGKTNEVSFSNDIKNIIETETQGITLTINMDTKSDGSMTVDASTSLVLNKKSSATINGNFEIMGQTSLISGTTTNTITTEVK